MPSRQTPADSLETEMASDDDSSIILPFRQRDQVPPHRSFRSDPSDLDTRLAARIRLDEAVSFRELMKGLCDPLVSSSCAMSAVLRPWT